MEEKILTRQEEIHGKGFQMGNYSKSIPLNNASTVSVKLFCDII